MIFFDSNNDMVRVSVKDKISHTYNSHYVYKTTDGRCLKVYRIYDVGPDLSLDSKIQSLQLDNFFQAEQFLFDRNGIYKAMLMPFYESCCGDVMLFPSDYLVDNFTSIFNSFERLSDECIETRDANYENMIFTRDSIVIIDSERYCQCSKDEMERVRQCNYDDVCWLLYLTLINGAARHLEFRDNDFRSYFATMKPDGREMCRVLSKRKYPIDYLRKIKKDIF